MDHEPGQIVETNAKLFQPSVNMDPQCNCNSSNLISVSSDAWDGYDLPGWFGFFDLPAGSSFDSFFFGDAMDGGFYEEWQAQIFFSYGAGDSPDFVEHRVSIFSSSNAIGVLEVVHSDGTGGGVGL